jgi:hypothetical protein
MVAARARQGYAVQIDADGAETTGTTEGITVHFESAMSIL